MVVKKDEKSNITNITNIFKHKAFPPLYSGKCYNIAGGSGGSAKATMNAFHAKKSFFL